MSNLSPTDRKTLDDFKGMTVGQIFKKSREMHGYDIMQIAAHLNIGSDYLIAIENDDSEGFPPRVYAIGFVRAYADLLGLDSEKMSYLFKVQAYGKKQTEMQKEFITTEGKNIGLQDMISSKMDVIPIILAFLILAGLAIAAVVFFVMWIMTPSDNDTKMSIPEVPAELLQQDHSIDDLIKSENIQEQLPVEPMDIIVKPDEGGASYGVNSLESALTFKILENVDVQIRNIQNGKVLIEKKLGKGDVFYVSQEQNILFSTPNAAAIEVYLDGQKLGILGKQNEKIRLRPFSVKALRLQRDG